MRVAITGGIADGKSTASQMIRDLGFQVVSADDIAHELLSSREVIDEIKERVGCEFVRSGKVDREALRAAIASSTNLRHRLNGVMHAKVMRKILGPSENKAVSFAEIPLLIETATQGEFHEVWVVCAGRELQLRRLEERLGSAELAEALLATQMPTEAKLAFADRIVRTNEPVETVRLTIARHVKVLVEG